MSEIYLTRGQAGCDLAVSLQAVAIVVDALRASTTIATLLGHGAGRVLVVAAVEDAYAMKAQMPDAVLAGERGGEKLPGFDFGNSPLEIVQAPGLAGKTVIFTSSNGAQRLTACVGAERVLVGTVCNVDALTAYVRPYATAHQRSIVIIAAGQYPNEAFVSPEDEASCLLIAQAIGLPIHADSAEIAAHWAREIDERGLYQTFQASAHAQHLTRIGFGEDILFCAQPATSHVLPIVTGPALLGTRQVGVTVEAVDVTA